MPDHAATDGDGRDRDDGRVHGTREHFIGVARAFGGALFFGLPLLMPMEMWWLGFVMDRFRLALFVAVDTVATTPGGHVVRVRVRNDGGVAVSNVHVQGELHGAGGAAEKAETAVD